MDYKFKTEPYAHQLHALGASHNKENYALFMEMGTGKSKVLVDNIAMLYDKGKINAALIVAPKGVYRNWERQEIPTHMPEHVLYNVVTWSPATTKKQDKASAFKNIRQLLADSQVKDYEDLFRLLYDEVDSYGKGHIAECILVIAKYELSDSQVVDKEINAMAMIIELLGVIK